MNEIFFFVAFLSTNNLKVVVYYIESTTVIKETYYAYFYLYWNKYFQWYNAKKSGLEVLLTKLGLTMEI